MKTILYIIIGVLLIGLVSAAPPLSVVHTGEVGLELKIPSGTTIKKDSGFEFEVHVFNKTNGVPMIDGISCYLHLYNFSGKHQFEGVDVVPSHTFDYSFDLNGGNFSEQGFYTYVAQCNTSTLGGFHEGYVEVTNDGKERQPTLVLSTVVLLGIIAFLFLIIGIFLYMHYKEGEESGET